MKPNPKVSVVMRRSEWQFLEAFLVAHGLAADLIEKGKASAAFGCKQMQLAGVSRRIAKIIAKINPQIIKAERRSATNKQPAGPALVIP